MTPPQHELVESTLLKNVSVSRRAPWVHGPLLLAITVFGALLALLIKAILTRCGGHFGYPMDDTYIHMAMACSLSQHGVWGLTRYGFSSSSSSPLFTLLLSAVYFIAGSNDFAPVVMNVVFGIALLWFCDYAFRCAAVASLPRTALLLLILFEMPLGPETIAGMEHVLQTLLALVFVFCASRMLSSARVLRRDALVLLSFAALAVLCRYETMALVGTAALLFWAKRRRGFAVSLLSAAVTPIALFGLISMAHGWFPIPNSIIAKTSRPGKGQWPFALHWAEQLHDVPALFFLVPAAIVLFVLLKRQGGSIWSVEATSLLLFCGAALVHLQFGRVGWFFRYEAYLVALGIYTCGVALNHLRLPAWRRSSPRRYTLGYSLGAGLLLVAFTPRVADSLWLTPYACMNIHDQQYQVGEFLRRNFAGETVMLSDIGAPAYLSDSRIVDLYGLANMAVTRAKLHHRFDLAFRRDLAEQEGAKIAIVFPAEYANVGGLPPEWIKVGAWKIPQNQICWSDTVTFFAVDPSYRDRLIKDLQQFDKRLPSGVKALGLRESNINSTLTLSKE